VIAAYPADALDKPIDRKKQTAAFSIRGIAAHDLYHAGQIQLLKRLQRAWKSFHEQEVRRSEDGS
jgi:uncharacterized protein YecT (DUF1311 family)